MPLQCREESSRKWEEIDVGRKRKAQRRSKIGSRVELPCADGSRALRSRALVVQQGQGNEDSREAVERKQEEKGVRR